MAWAGTLMLSDKNVWDEDCHLAKILEMGSERRRRSEGQGWRGTESDAAPQSRLAWYDVDVAAGARLFQCILEPTWRLNAVS